MKGLSIVLADDHAVTRRGVRAALQEHIEWSIVAEAVDGPEAWEQVLKWEPNLIILDVSMPGMNGLEVTRKIRQEQPATAVLILTMHDSPDLLKELQEAGAAGLVLKSDPDSVLVQAVESIGRGGTYWSTSRLCASPFKPSLIPELSANRPADPPKLTPREREIVQLVTEGRSSKEVADLLQLSIKTVESHRTNILQKLKLRSVSDLVRFAIRNHIIQP